MLLLTENTETIKDTNTLTAFLTLAGAASDRKYRKNEDTNTDALTTLLTLADVAITHTVLAVLL